LYTEEEEMRKNNRIPRQKPIKSGKTESGTYW
jgi:hypothetical protein